ncbi:MAG: polyphenol oxidase family protein [Clostridiales bacterium]|jgi:YfiH family protein|nr:polyphenol oxidase family protein [Clostridiales bacterium]
MMQAAFLSAYANTNSGYLYDDADGVGIFGFPAFSATGLVRHGFTARIGGVSTGPYTSLNMSFTRPGEPRENVMKNHRLFAKRAGIGWQSMVMDTFEHGVTVLEVDQSHCGMGYFRPSLPYCDGLVTKHAGVTLVTGHADCVPLYALDRKRRHIGLAHAGWKGTLGKIGCNMINMMRTRFGSDPTDLLAGVGPCICGDCFEVSEDLAARFMDAYPGVPLVSPGKPGKGYLDLAMASAAQFLESGIPPAQISLMHKCTYEDPTLLYSHRRDRGQTGGMSAFIQLLPPAKNAFMQLEAPLHQV